MFKLVIQDDEGKTTVVPLIRDEITIGRKEGNTIRLTERNVSRRHARILRNNGEVHIEDLGSYNGIRVNNARIAERVSLRVSDQVQIGDYKLYLKAEGVEQVDDARTMPIERVNEAVAPTESMPAIAAPAPTAPVPVQAPPAVAQGTQPPAAAPAPAPMVGNANRTLVAMDGSALQNLTAGRPVADPALVAKLNETASYGRLVVLSSNFAGKEFELSRPQMIIGRTNENDFVIDHRSISRNHAKVTREPETGRYTISDLQSSNGVRVNGQDYGKVELRRGDVVDLGHVRLRFIEPGEDFVFARDAVVTDVPEAGGKKGLMVAVVLGVIVVIAIGAVWAMRGDSGGGKDNNEPPGPGTNDPHGVVTVDAGKGPDQVANKDIDAAVEVQPPPVIDAATMVATPDAATGSNGSATVPTNNNEVDELDKACRLARAQTDWVGLAECATKMGKIDATKGSAWATIAHNESTASTAKAHLDTEILKGDLDASRRYFDQIGKGTAVYAEADKEFRGARTTALKNANRRASELSNAHECDKLKSFRSSLPVEIRGDVSGECKPKEQGDGSGSGSNTPPPNKDCESQTLENHKASAQAEIGSQNYGAALADYEAVLKCRPGDASVLQGAYLAACGAGRNERARSLYKALVSAGRDPNIKQICMTHGGFDPSSK